MQFRGGGGGVGSERKSVQIGDVETSRFSSSKFVVVFLGCLLFVGVDHMLFAFWAFPEEDDASEIRWVLTRYRGV